MRFLPVASVLRSKLEVLHLRHFVPLSCEEVELSSPRDGPHHGLVDRLQMYAQGGKMFARRVEPASVLLGILQYEAMQRLALGVLNVLERTLRSWPPQFFQPLELW